jgi:hypothetical protein
MMTDEETARAWSKFSDYVANNSHGTMGLFVSQYRDLNTGMISRYSVPVFVAVIGLGEDFQERLYGEQSEASIDSRIAALKVRLERTHADLSNQAENLARILKTLSETSEAGA